jgi:hypothetical protein
MDPFILHVFCNEVLVWLPDTLILYYWRRTAALVLDSILEVGISSSQVPAWLPATLLVHVLELEVLHRKKRFS